MPAPWITDADLKQALADLLKYDVLDLNPSWDRLVPLANADAAGDINSILLAKGFTAAQIDQWDNRVTYNRDIALYHLLVKGAALAAYDQTTVDKLDRRKMLEESAALMINGAIVTPGADDSAGVGGGVIDDSNYRINMDTQF
jgi:hypothetical protein